MLWINPYKIRNIKIDNNSKLLETINNTLGLTFAKFKKESIEIYKNSSYQFPYDSTFIHNLFYKNKEIS